MSRIKQVVVRVAKGCKAFYDSTEEIPQNKEVKVNLTSFIARQIKSGALLTVERSPAKKKKQTTVEGDRDE